MDGDDGGEEQREGWKWGNVQDFENLEKSRWEVSTWKRCHEVENVMLMWRRYVVNTQLPRPHENSDLTALTFAPLQESTSGTRKGVSSPYLLTAASDGTVKIWHVRQAKSSDQGELFRPKSSSESASFVLFFDMMTNYIT